MRRWLAVAEILRLVDEHDLRGSSPTPGGGRDGTIHGLYYSPTPYPNISKKRGGGFSGNRIRDSVRKYPVVSDLHADPAP